MNYLEVPNWKKHQHRDLADKGNMPWFKLESGIFDDHAIAQLTAAEFRAYIRALTLAARTGNKLLAEPGWLRAHFGTKWRPLCARLVQLSLLEDHSGTLKHPQTNTTDRATDAPTALLEERRQEETRTKANVYVDVEEAQKQPIDIPGFKIIGRFDFEKDAELNRIKELLRDSDDLTLERLRREANGLAIGWVCRVRESIERKPARSFGVGYAVNALRSALREAA